MGKYILTAAAFLIVLLLIYFVKTYNSFVKARNRVKTQWAQIDVQLTRRAELIPNLVECVKGYASHEKDTLERVIAARKALMDADTPKRAMEANSQLSMILPGIFAVAEAYPDLKANTVFLQMQTELSETESKIAYARQFYNDTVLIYNDKINQFPGSVAARLFGLRQEDFFAAEEGKRQNVRIHL